VDFVAEALFAGLDLPAADPLESYKLPTDLRDDPHVDHQDRRELHE
jgi:hypothetical protein